MYKGSAPASSHPTAKSQVKLEWRGKVPGRSDLPTYTTQRGKAPVLEEARLFGDSGSSLLVQGDSGLVMPVLLAGEGLRSMANSVKLCYLDPPYNTGENFLHYSDKRTREDWLNSLRDYLLMVRRALHPTGSVWLHLDDSEQHRARCILDEVFGEDAFVGTIIWQKRTSRDSRKAFSSMHDYIHVYSPSGPKEWKKIRNGIPDTGAFMNPDGDPRGPWRSVPMTAQAGHGTAKQFYTVTTPTGTQHVPPVGRCWTYSAERLAELDAEGRVYWPRGGDGKPRLKRYRSEVKGLPPFTIWSTEEAGDTSLAKKDLLRQFPNVPVFDTPKPLMLLERIVAIATDPGDLVLDPFLGSGTSAVAAQLLGRRWIGIEENTGSIRNFVIPRLKQAFDKKDVFGVNMSIS